MDNTETKNILKAVRILIFILAAFLLVHLAGAVKGLRQTSPSYNSITVNGEGEAYAIPDLATFSFSVSADAKTVSVAQEQVTEKINSIIAALKGMGIEEKDIKTSDYNVWPKYSYSSQPCSPNYCPPEKQTQDGFTASHSVTVKVRKTDDAGKALALAGEKGATNLSGVSFTIDDPEEITNEARSKAIADAKTKADELARELGVRVVRVVSFGENSGGGPILYREALGMGVSDAKVAPAPTLPKGENRVVVQVNVTYEIR